MMVTVTGDTMVAVLEGVTGRRIRDGDIPSRISRLTPEPDFRHGVVALGLNPSRSSYSWMRSRIPLGLSLLLHKMGG